VELFLTIWHGIKYRDIGILRRSVDPLIINFLGARQTNYAYKMLFYWWLLKDSVYTPKL
ncbi:hypothetical protein DL95DRAFT_296562, partial [Leptodontidium sp. 2 PMI_412]